MSAEFRKNSMLKLWKTIPWAVLLTTLLLLGGCARDQAGFIRGTSRFHTVVVDAGHGGFDLGARAISGSREKTLNLDTSRRLASELSARGFRVKETRTKDVFVPLSNRSQVANHSRGSVFVSIHYNWSRRAGARGIEIFYNSPQSRRLAANVLQEVVRVYRTDNRGIKRADFYVLRTNKRPAILCELGFLSNPQDNQHAQSPHYRQRLAEAIAEGILAERRGRIPSRAD